MEEQVVSTGGRANIKAAGGDYEGALAVLNSGIEKFPMEPRFWNNRCYFLCKTKEYKKALDDANEMVLRFPDNIKSYFRRGQALVGLKMYKEAEVAFQKVLERNQGCTEATAQIFELEIMQIMDLGYSRMCAQEALACSRNVAEAIEYASQNAMTCGTFGDTIYHSDGEFYDDDDIDCGVDGKQYPDKFMDSSNPRGISSLWVGNVDDVSEDELLKMFSAYGKIASMSLLTDKRCAFINFADPKSAGLAMKALQGKAVGDGNLIIKYPNNAFGKRI